MIIHELKQHGTEDFPFQLYQLNQSHPKYEMAFHWHSNLEIIRVLEGSLSLTLDNRSVLLTVGSVAFVNSETVHGATPRDCIYECIVFNLSFLKTGNSVCDSFIENLLLRNAFLEETPREPSILSLTNRVFEEIALSEEGSRFKVIGLLFELLGEFQTQNAYHSQLPPSSERNEKKIVKLKTALQFIRQNYARDIRLEDISAAVNVSSKYCCQFFKDMTGTTPVNYLTSYRIERASRRLLGSDDSVSQIAYDCGFNDLSYFIKTFKRLRGVSPMKYRSR